MNEIIDLDKNKDSGYFWKFFSKIYNVNFTFVEYISSLKIDLSDIKIFNYKNHIYKMKIYKSKYKPEIKIYWGDCIVYTLKTNENIESELSEFSTECEDIISSKLIIKNTKSEFLLKFIDSISRCFGVKRIQLIDASTPRKYQHVYIDKNNQNEQDIDLSLYMIMKYGETFYERYGYNFCDKDIEYKIQKDLLQTFKFDVFYYLLNDIDKEIVKKYKKSYKCKYLGEFYVQVYDYLNKQDNKKLLLELQSLLFNKNYPWYSMVSILTIKKKCMDKYLI